MQRFFIIKGENPMKKYHRLCIASVMLLFAACAVWAELDKEEQAKVDALAATLQLNAKQKALVTKDREKSKQILLQLEKKWQQLHDQLRREVRRDKPDQGAVDKITEEIGKIQGEIVALRTNSLIYLKSLLTPQQAQIIEQDRLPDTAAESEK
jgi:Spy/CpxP family protein refolding chaperone